MRLRYCLATAVVVLVVPVGALAQHDPSASDAEAAGPEDEVLAQEAASGADAANPTAAVSFQDVRYRYFDLDGGSDQHSFETEGALMVHPRLKITNELRGVNTDRSGSRKLVQDTKVKLRLLPTDLERAAGRGP